MKGCFPGLSSGVLPAKGGCISILASLTVANISGKLNATFYHFFLHVQLKTHGTSEMRTHNALTNTWSRRPFTNEDSVANLDILTTGPENFQNRPDEY